MSTLDTAAVPSGASDSPAPLLPGSVQPAPPGAKGFDANLTITGEIARAFKEQGYQFCIRYVGRVQNASYDLTAAEARIILGAGLALMVVQHVKQEGWQPTGDLGTQYGADAAQFVRAIGLPPGVSVWCDLEGVAPGTSAADTIAYCNNWCDGVAAAGYSPGLYVGWHSGLTAEQLYDSLRFKHYWQAYNLDQDEVPSVRGVQLRQSPGTGGTIAGVTTESYDDDYTMLDQLGGTAIWLAPES